MREGRQWLALTLAQLYGATALRAELLRVTGVLTGRQGDHRQGLHLLAESLDIWRTLGDKQGIASALLGLGVGAMSLGSYERAIIYYEECFPLLRETGDKHSAAFALNSLGLALFLSGKPRTSQCTL